MGCLAQHCPQLGRATFGDVAVSIALAGLKGARHQSAVTGGMLGAGEAAYFGEDRKHGERDDRPYARHHLQPFNELALLMGTLTQS